MNWVTGLSSFVAARIVPFADCGGMRELTFTATAREDEAIIRQDRAVFTAGRLLLSGTRHGVTMQFRLRERDIAEENASLNYRFDWARQP